MDLGQRYWKHIMDVKPFLQWFLKVNFVKIISIITAWSKLSVTGMSLLPVDIFVFALAP